MLSLCNCFAVVVTLTSLRYEISCPDLSAKPDNIRIEIFSFCFRQNVNFTQDFLYIISLILLIFLQFGWLKESREIMEHFFPRIIKYSPKNLLHISLLSR